MAASRQRALSEEKHAHNHNSHHSHNNHHHVHHGHNHSELRINLHSIMDDTNFSDIIFVVEGNEFNGISALFAAQSQVFKSMLFGSYEESIKNRGTNKRIIIQDMTMESFKFIKNHFYFQNPKLNCDIVIDVLYSAKIYFIQSLIIKCQQYIINIEKPKNFYKIIRAFSKYPQSTFYPFFKQFIINCKALNISNSYSDDKNQCDTYYNDKYLLLNDKLFEKYFKFWQIEEMLSSGINDEKMYNACLRFNQYHKTDIIPKLIHLFDFKNKFNTNIDLLICNNKYLSKDKIINILRNKLNTNNKHIRNTNKGRSGDNGDNKSNDDDDNKSNQDNNTNDDALNDGDGNDEDEQNGFRMNEMLLTDSDLSSLRIGDKIDHRDYKGRWCKASITQKQFMFIKLHYVGWNSQYDCWIHISEDYEKLAKYGRITRRQVQRTKLQNLQINDRVLIRLPSCHRFHYMQWITAKVSYIEEDTGQIKFSYGITNNNDNKYSWWTHPDNLDECKPYIVNIPQQQQQPMIHVALDQDEEDQEEEDQDGDEDEDEHDDDDHNVIGNGVIMGNGINDNSQLHLHSEQHQEEEDEDEEGGEDDDQRLLTYDNFEDESEQEDEDEDEDEDINDGIDINEDDDDEDNNGMIMCD